MDLASSTRAFRCRMQLHVLRMWTCMCCTCGHACAAQLVVADGLSLHVQEAMAERLRKHGQDTPFGLFMRRETEIMSACLLVIHTDLQVGTATCAFYTGCNYIWHFG